MTALNAVDLTAKLCGLVALVQGLELVSLYPTYSSRGIWRWRDLKQELGCFSAFLFIFLTPPVFWGLQLVRLIFAVSLFIHPHPFSVLVLIVIHFFSLIRWRGNFNGGSDSMTMVVLIALFVSLAFLNHFSVVFAALSYVTFQLVLSYFKAGYLKIKTKAWRNGGALKEFMLSPKYSSLNRLGNQSPKTFFALSWLVIIFELSFPLSLLHPHLTLIFAGGAAFFHLTLVYLFGLNRFFFSWAAAYPSLYFCSFYLHLKN